VLDSGWFRSFPKIFQKSFGGGRHHLAGSLQTVALNLMTSSLVIAVAGLDPGIGPGHVKRGASRIGITGTRPVMTPK
jgi:hypothetical protein